MASGATLRMTTAAAMALACMLLAMAVATRAESRRFLAVAALQEAAEAYLVGLFNNSCAR
ncbi:hypothetical protein ACP4OV_003528 [Aristida adscensionis]